MPERCTPPPGDLQPGTTISVGPIQTFGFGGHAGADYLDVNGNKICPDAVCNYWALRNFNTQGAVDGGGFPVQPRGVEMARLEFYPDLVAGNWGTNDVWSPSLTVGGLHLWNPDGRTLNGLRLPHASNGAQRYVAGAAGIADGRLSVHVFQLVNKDTTPGAFNISTTRGGKWTAGWIWPGTYEIYVRDNITGRDCWARDHLSMASPKNLSLSLDCFGLARRRI